ncbi:hypothetical protein J6590_019272 [Homalodisca vitripennis]|nr:hypothetical protein J6590_019272 [Homalodisca vitripennis]
MCGREEALCLALSGQYLDLEKAPPDGSMSEQSESGQDTLGPLPPLASHLQRTSRQHPWRLARVLPSRRNSTGTNLFTLDPVVPTSAVESRPQPERPLRVSVCVPQVLNNRQDSNFRWEPLKPELSQEVVTHDGRTIKRTEMGKKLVFLAD